MLFFGFLTRQKNTKSFLNLTYTEKYFFATSEYFQQLGNIVIKTGV